MDREGARHFLAGTPFRRSGCSERGPTSEDRFSYPISSPEDVVMAYNQQYILAGQMQHAQVVIIHAVIRVLASDIRASTWSRKPPRDPLLGTI